MTLILWDPCNLGARNEAASYSFVLTSVCSQYVYMQLQNLVNMLVQINCIKQISQSQTNTPSIKSGIQTVLEKGLDIPPPWRLTFCLILQSVPNWIMCFALAPQCRCMASSQTTKEHNGMCPQLLFFCYP